MKRSVESLKLYAKESLSRFNARRAIGRASLVLTVVGGGYIVGDEYLSDMKDEAAAVPLIAADGFNASQANVSEGIGGGSVTITNLKVGSDCTFGSVDARLTYHHDHVVGVDNYQIPFDPRGNTAAYFLDASGNSSTAMLTIQNAADLGRAVPGLHC